MENGWMRGKDEGSSANAFPKTELDDDDDGCYNPPPLQPLLNDTPSSSSSSSSSHLRAYFIGMGYSPSLVDSVIADNKGQRGDVELILDALIRCSGGLENSSSDSTFFQPKQEQDVLISNKDDKRASLFEMEFSPKYVEFAMRNLGEDAPFEEIVDFIIAAQNSDNPPVTEVGNDKEATNETLFSTMEKTISLLKMGFSENDISSVIEKYEKKTEKRMGTFADYSRWNPTARIQK